MIAWFWFLVWLVVFCFGDCVILDLCVGDGLGLVLVFSAFVDC